MNSFEQRFLEKIPHKMKDSRILLAVSGGADSVCLLKCCSSVCKSMNWQLQVVTVNHMIREKSESEGDCLFVNELCLGLGIPCTIVNAKADEIFQLEKIRNKGIEEAARFFRYEALENFAEEHNMDYIFLAHNKNDQLETLVQRFLQGAFADSFCGIPEQRGKFYRPLLDFSRSEIEEYLSESGLSFKTDCTNSDTAYFRNRIRKLVLPVLSENFPGYETAILHGRDKRQLDEDFFSSVLNDIDWNYTVDGAWINSSVFNGLHLALKIRLVYKALEKIPSTARVSYENILKFCQGNKVCTCGLVMESKKDKVFINTVKNSGKEQLLFAIIEKSGIFSVGSYVLTVSDSELHSKKVYSATLPFSISIKGSDVKIDGFSRNGRKVYFTLGTRNERQQSYEDKIHS